MDKQELLNRIRDAHDAIESEIAGLDERHMTDPGVLGDWSIKDILAHIAGWERLFLAAWQAQQRGDEVHWPEAGATLADVDRINERMHQENRDRPLHDVLAERRHQYDEMVRAVTAMADDELNLPGRYEWMRGQALLPAVRANSDEHYLEHVDEIRIWRQSQQSGR